MQWFLGPNEGGPGFEIYCDLAKVAIHTALSCTSLEPYLIYDGNENHFTRWVRSRGVTIIAWCSSLFQQVTDLGRRMQNPGFGAALPGVFLRVDLPKIALQYGFADRVLYTDCDVMFREDIADLLAPITCKYFAATIESDRTLPDDMNSGVMWMHLPEMANVDERFREFVCENIDELPGSSWDQGAYRKFFRAADGARLWDHIPLELNWKPYWEENPQARIIHFHGPKPFHRKYIRSHFPELEHFTGGCYSVLCDAWENLLYEANR